MTKKMKKVKPTASNSKDDVPTRRKKKSDKKPLNNVPPQDPNTQSIPKRFQTILNTSLKRKPRKKKSNLMDTARYLNKDIGFYPKDGKPFKPVPTVKQFEGENSHSFMRRVRDASKMVLSESKFQEKFKVDVTRDDSGNVLGIHQRVEKDVLERKENKRIKSKEWKLKKKMKKNKGKSGAHAENKSDLEDDYTKEGKRRKLLTEEANKEIGEDKPKGRRRKDEEELDEEANEEEENIDDREKKLFRRETFVFGDIVHRPPKLDTSKLEKKVKEDKQMKIRNFLFLDKLKGNEATPAKEVDSTTASKDRKVMLEEERQKAVFAYRQMKAMKMEKT